MTKATLPEFQAASLSGPGCRVRISEPYAITRILRVKQSYCGWTLLRFFSERFPWRESDHWKEKILRGYIRVQDEQVAPDFILQNGHLIQHDSEGVTEPSVPDHVKVIQESEEWVVVSKPAPLPVHAGGRYFRNTLLTILQERGYGELYPLHRLDAVTQGLICLAKKEESVPILSRWLRSESSKKVYYAHVNGVPSESFTDIHTPIRRKQGFVFESVPELAEEMLPDMLLASDQAEIEGTEPVISEVSTSRPLTGRSALKKAHTRIEVVKLLQHSAIVRCIPITGRTHQLRIHLRDWGYPIVDDPIYGPEGNDSGEVLQNRAISLLSARIEVPEAGINAELPIPEEWIIDV